MSKGQSTTKDMRDCLPALRRFAIAMAGSRDLGDTNVLKLLKHMRASSEDKILSESTVPALCAMLLEHWSEPDEQNIVWAELNMSRAGQYLSGLPVRIRGAILLATLERLPPDEAVRLAKVESKNFSKAFFHFSETLQEDAKKEKMVTALSKLNAFC